MTKPEVPLPPEALGPDPLRQIVDVLAEGVVVLDADGAITLVNPAGAALLGRPAAELVGLGLDALSLRVTDEDGHAMPLASLPPLRVLATGMAPPPGVVGLTTPEDPGPRWIEMTARPLRTGKGDQLTGAVASLRDVTEWHQTRVALAASEERYHALAQAVPVGICRADAQGRCTWVNEGMAEIAGRDAEACLGDGWVEAIHPDDRENVLRAWQEAVEKGTLYQVEHRMLHPTGEVRWVLCRMVEERDDQGERIGYHGSVTDITTGKLSGHEKDQLIGLVSHELRAPLVSIRGGLTFLEPYISGVDADGRRLFDMAVRNAEVLDRLVRDLLDIERLEAGRLVLEPTDVDPLALLREARGMVLSQAEDRGVAIVIPDDVGPSVWVDWDRLLQVATNLLSNAVKFSDPGGVVTVAVEEAPERVVLSVRDHGRGIPSDFHERIFERFIQVDSADGAERGGTGLGLAISRAIVAAHGGRIWVESAPAAGSTFFLELPVR